MKKLFLACIIVFQGCVVSKPKVENASYSSAMFSHTNFLTSCIACHETIRPGTSSHLNYSGATINSPSHYSDQDCVKCHKHSTGLTLPSAWAFNHSPAQSSCVDCHEVKRPPAPHITSGDCASCHAIGNWKSTSAFNHTPLPSSCLTCHDSVRPATSTHLNSTGASVVTNSHYTGQDCATCHSPTTGTYPTAWAFKHSPAQTSCVACHEVKRPASPHIATGDCISCHTIANWTSTAAFNHNPTPASCLTCHGAVRPATSTHLNTLGVSVVTNSHYSTQDCATCHSPATGTFPTAWAFKHSPTQTSCASCHEVKRPVAPHVATGDCVSCHTLGTWVTTAAFSHNPTPTSCITCHTKDRPTVNTGHNTKSKGHYNSVSECLSCHSTPAVISTTTWKSGSSLTCILCHLSKGVSEHGSSANAGGSHSNCKNCHSPTKSSW